MKNMSQAEIQENIELAKEWARSDYAKFGGRDVDSVEDFARMYGNSDVCLEVYEEEMNVLLGGYANASEEWKEWAASEDLRDEDEFGNPL